jgi:type I restriction enzyme S subunit
MYRNGRAFSDREWGEVGRPIIRIQNLTGTGTSFNRYEGDVDEHHIVRSGDLLVSWAATLGVYVWHGEEAALNQHIFKVTSSINQGYHRYVLEWALDSMRRDTHGSGMVHITKRKFDATLLPLAPLEEQGRIVVELERRLSHVDRAISGARLALERVEQARRSVLASAYRGTLVEQVHDEEPAWLVSPQAESSEGLPDGWIRLPVGALVKSKSDITDGPFGSNLKTEHYTDSGPRVVRLQNIGDGSFVDAQAHISEEHFQRLTKHEVKSGDVLVASLGECLPRACVAPDWLGSAIVKADCIRVRPVKGIDPGWLSLMLNSPQVRAQVASQIKGVGRPRINLGELRQVVLPIPPSGEQERTFAEASRVQSILDAAERSVHRGIASADLLRRSLIASAFRGELVPQDPTDEPAAELLRRIQAARADTSTEVRRSQRKKEKTTS